MDQIKSLQLHYGAAVVTILVFGAIFTMLLTVLMSTVTIQERVLRNQLDKSAALQIAEAGLEELRWYLAHYPQDYNGWDDAPINSDGEYVFTSDYEDPISGVVVGEIEFVVKPEIFCDITANAEVTVTGTSFAEGQSYTIQQVHSKDTAANYAYIYNDDVRAGADRLIRGRYHSNQEVEMNGANDSVVSSSQTDGVYGNPVNPDARADLWQDEVGTIDFNAMALDLSVLREKADNYNGSPDGDQGDDRYFTLTESCYEYACWSWWPWPPGYKTCQSCSSSDAFEVELVNDGDSDTASIKVWELYDLRTVPRSNDTNEPEKYCGNGSSINYSNYDDADHDIPGISTDSDGNIIEPAIQTCDDGRYYDLDNDGTDESTYLGEFALDNSCPVAFFEGNVFLHGTADAKLLIAAAKLDDADDAGVYIINNIDYENYEGDDGLTVVAEGDIKIPYSVPDDMGIRGIFIAQSGRYGRDNYGGSGWTLFDDRDFLQTIGSIISYEGGGTQWVYSDGTFVSGFRDRENYYDRSLSRRPPPLTPTVTENYSYVEWRDSEATLN